MPRWIDDLLGYNQILADDGTPARRRHILKFVGATVADDGEATVVTTSGATTQAEYFLGAPEPSLPNHRLPVESSTIGWNLATPNTFVAFVKPGSVLAALQFREQDVDVAQRDKLNVINTASITLDFTDDSIAEEVELRATRAALSGAITAAAGDNVTSFGAAAPLSVLSNATNGSAVPDYLQAGAAREHLRVNAAGTALEWGLLQLADFPAIPSDTFLANVGIAPAVPTAVTFDSVAGIGLDWDDVANEFNVTNVPVGSLAAIGANTVVANPTNASAVPTTVSVTSESVLGRTSGNIQSIASSAQTALIRSSGSLFFAGAANDQVLRRSGAGDLGFGTLVTGNIGDNQVTAAKMFDLAGLSLLGRAGNTTGDMAAITASAVGQVPKVNSAGTAIAWVLPIDVFNNAIPQGGVHSLVAQPSTSNTWNVDVGAGAWFMSVQRAALSGAIAAAANGNDTLFSGIRVNDGLTTDRQNINFLTSLRINPSATDDAIDDEIVLSFDLVAASVTNTFLADIADARIKGRARGASLGPPQDLTGTEAGSILRFGTTEDKNVAGLATSVVIGAGTTNLRFSNGGATGIIRSIAAPTEEGQIVFPEMTTGGGDEFVYVHEDTSQTAADRVQCPGNRPFRGNSGGPPHMLYYAGRSNRWTIIGPVGGHHAAIVDIDEHFDWAIFPSAIEGSVPTFINFTSSNHSWAAAADPNVGPAANYQSINNELSHRGILRITTAEDNGDAFALYLGRDVDGTLNVNDDLYDSDNIQHFACWLRIPTATSIRVIAGFCEAVNNIAGGTEFIGFEADTSGGISTTNWVLVCRTDSVSTNVDSGVAFGTAWHKLEWFRYDEYVIFYINRVFAGLISTNVPNGGGTIALRVQTRTTAERSLDVDRVIVEVLESSMD